MKITGNLGNTPKEQFDERGMYYYFRIYDNDNNTIYDVKAYDSFNIIYHLKKGNKVTLTKYSISYLKTKPSRITIDLPDALIKEDIKYIGFTY